MTRKGIRLFGAYVKENIGGIALAICAALMLTALFYLYELPKEPLIYALALIGAIALLPFLLKYAYIKKRHTELEAILNNIAQVLGELPPPHGVLEHDYSDMLKKLDEARNRLTGEYEKEIGDMLEQYTLWAHQIKTPIAAMRLLIQSNASADELASELFKIEQYVETALCIMRSGGNSPDFVIRNCDVDETVRKCVRKYARLFVLNRLKLELSETHITALTDEKWLAFAIEQALSNALKYTPSGKISIYARGSVLVIADTGIGIAPQALPRIFERGYTGSNGRGDMKATGIGLYLSKRMLSMLGHAIWAESEPSKGTRIMIDLSRDELEIE